MRKYLTVLLLLVFIIPSVAFASWWNPFSWRVFSFLNNKVSNQNTQNLNNESVGDTKSEIERLQNRINELENNKLNTKESDKNISNTSEKDALASEIKAQVKAELLKKAKEEAVSNVPKTLSEQVGVNKDKFIQCVKDTDSQAIRDKTNLEAEKAMKGLPPDQRGTPYAVIIGKNGSKAEIRGAYPKEDINKLIAEVIAGKVTVPYTGDVTGYKDGEHITGSPSAPIMIIEYSDLECPYCKRFGETMSQIISESNGGISWVYRHWIVHPGALSKTVASECVSKLKGNDAFWKYIKLVFALMDPKEVVSDSSNL